MVDTDFSMGANANRAVGRKVCLCSGGAVLRHGRRVVSGVSVCSPPASLLRYLMKLLTPPHPLTRRTCVTTSSIPICASLLRTSSYSATFSCLQRIPSLTAMPVRVYNITIIMSIQYGRLFINTTAPYDLKGFMQYVHFFLISLLLHLKWVEQFVC